MRPTRSILLAASACFVASLAHAAGTYYVDPSSPDCSKAGPGTEDQPYCTISAALAARGAPGVTILVRPGVYREQVSVPASGAPDQPLVLRAAGGVVVDGADDFSDPSRWTAFTGNVWLAEGVDWSPKQVFAGDARLAPSTAAPAALPAGSFRWVAGLGLYVNAGAGHPAAHRIEVGRRSYGITVPRRAWVVVDGFAVTRTEDRGIFLSDSCTHVAVTRNTVSFSAKIGIQAVKGVDIRIGSNVVHECGDHGISLTTGVTGSTVEDNESFRNARPAERAANGIYLFGSPGNLLRRNRLHHNQDTGLHIQSGSNRNVAYLNQSWNNGDHGYDQLEATGTIHVCDVAYGNYKDGFSIEGNATDTQLHDCIAVDNGLTTNEFDLWVDEGSMPGFVSDYNIFWNSTRQPPVKCIATRYSKVSAYSRAHGRDSNTLQVDPQFVNPAAGDFRLQPGSPAIDSGSSGVPNWPANDAAGRARVDDPRVPNRGQGPVPHSDRGALEHQPDAPTPTSPSGAATPSSH